MWKTQMVLIAPELGNDEGVNVTVYHLGFFGLSIIIENKKNPLWRECEDERSLRHRKFIQDNYNSFREQHCSRCKCLNCNKDDDKVKLCEEMGFIHRV